MLPKTSWVLPDIDRNIQSLLVKEIGVNPIVADILLNRNISTLEDAQRFLSPSLADLHNPFLLRDMDVAVDRAITAIEKHEKIVIYGDYDADGITSTVLLLQFLKECKRDASFYIPDRIKEGYGLNNTAIDKLRNDGVSLIITVDCGISDIACVDYAGTLGIDVIILDHHEIRGAIPDAEAVINPHRKDNCISFPLLAGVGVAYNFLIALRGRLRETGFWNAGDYPNLKKYLDLVALGTIADLVPLTDENRIFAKIGLELINNPSRPGLKALIQISGLENKKITSEVAAFTLIPRINAAGRIGSPDEAVRLFMTENMSEAISISERLDDLNQNRKNIENEILKEILDDINDNLDVENLASLVFSSSSWHPGVIGIVASKLVDRFYRPTVLFSVSNGIAKGSARSIKEFNLYDGLSSNCLGFLQSFGGHSFAAGVTVLEEDIEPFSRCLNETVANSLQSFDFIPHTYIDAVCKLEEVDYKLVYQLEELGPYGNSNPEPILCTHDTSIHNPLIVGSRHLKMRVQCGKSSFDSIWFNMGRVLEHISGSASDIIFTPQINRWNHRTSIQLKLLDIDSFTN